MAINPLSIPSYGPALDITGDLANLTKTLNEGMKRQTLADLGKGLADGTLDYKQAAAKAATLGDLGSTMSLLKLGQEQEASKAFGNSLSSLYGGALSPQPSVAARPSVAGPTVPNDSNAMPGQVGMDLRLADRSQDFIQDNPGTTMSSGVRSTADQARLYADRGNNPNPVAAPGTSRHERGLAIDIGGMTPEQRSMLPQYGLAQPVANDPPHVELAPNVQVASNDPAALPVNAQATQGYAIPGQSAEPGGISQRAIQLIRAMSIPGISAAQKEMGGKLLAVELEQSKLPDAVKQYVYAKAQGYQGTLLDFKKEVAGAGKTEVNVDTKGQNAFAKAGGESVAKRFEKLSEEGDTATQDLALVGQLRDLGQTIQTGAPAAIQGWLAQHGVKVGANVGAVEAYGAIVDKLTPTQRVPGSGATSDYEGKMFKNSLPTLMKTPEGNEIVQNTLAGLAQYKIDRARIAEQALSGEIEPKEAIKQLRNLPSPYDNFKKFAKSGFKADPNSPIPAAPPQTQQATPPMQGARQAPDGKFYVPDPNRPGKYLQVQ